MKKKHRLILLFMLVFTGVTLLGSSSAFAVLSCSPDEKAAGICMEVCNQGACADTETPVYILKALANDENKTTAVFPGSNWPQYLVDRTVFRYITGVSDKCILDASCKPSAQSYVWFSLHHIPPLGTSPNGAQLNIANMPSSCGDVELGVRIAYKLNRIASYQKDGIIRLYEKPATGFDAKCGGAGIVWSSLCGTGKLLVPSGGDVPVQETTTYKCADTDVTVEVTINPCTLQIDNVFCEGGGITGYATPTATTWGRAQDLNDLNRIDEFPIENIGPGTPGCIVCTKDYPVVLRGNEAWWCGGRPPGPAPTQ